MEASREIAGSWRGKPTCNLLYLLKLVFIILLSPFGVSAQVILTGKVVEENTNTVIPYVTIGLVKQNTGTNANNQGVFSIRCNEPGVDTIIVSCVGYKSLRFPVKDLLPNSTLFLSVVERQLKPVVVKNKWRETEAGGYKKYQDYCYTSNGYEWQVAKKMTAPIENSRLRSILIRTSKYYPRNALFRVHVYGLDTLTNGPGEELTDTLIEVSSKGRAVYIDALPFEIWLPGREFFISVEWLRIPVNERRVATRFEGKDTLSLTYTPCLCFTKDPVSMPQEIWHLAYSGKWYSWWGNTEGLSLAISAVVLY